MAENDIYNNKNKYEYFKANYKQLLKKNSKVRKIRKYYCKNPTNLKYFEQLFKAFEARDISYVRRMRLFTDMRQIVFAMDKDLKDCDREDIDKIVTYMHTAYKSPKSKRDFIVDIKHLWKTLFPETDNKGRADDSIVPYPVRHLSSKTDPSREKTLNDRLTIEEYEQLITAFSNDPRIQLFISLSFESFGRPQEILYTRLRDIENHEHYAVIHISEHGKEGTGILQCIDSYPYLTKWLNMHPLKHDKNAFIFINTGDTKKGQQLKITNINKHLKEKLLMLKINKRITTYSFKRNGITYSRIRGDSDMEIQHKARWSSTKQLQAYDKTDQEDALKIALIKKGYMKPDKKEYKKYVPTEKKCVFCEHINPFDNVFCDNCKRPLDSKKIITNEKNRDKELSEMKAAIKSMNDKLNDPQFFANIASSYGFKRR